VGSVFGAVFGLALVGSGIAADFIGRKRTLVAGTILFPSASSSAALRTDFF
jgi:MFS family permease